MLIITTISKCCNKAFPFAVRMKKQLDEAKIESLIVASNLTDPLCHKYSVDRKQTPCIIIDSLGLCFSATKADDPEFMVNFIKTNKDKEIVIK